MESIRDNFPKITDKKIREKWQKIISDSAEGRSSGSSSGDPRYDHLSLLTEEDQQALSPEHFRDICVDEVDVFDYGDQVDHSSYHYPDEHSYGQEDYSHHQQQPQRHAKHGGAQQSKYSNKKRSGGNNQAKGGGSGSSNGGSGQKDRNSRNGGGQSAMSNSTRNYDSQTGNRRGTRGGRNY